MYKFANMWQLILLVVFQLNKLTVAALKDCVKKLKIKAAGTKKADLVEAINEHFDI